jgi:hypothetical protein
MYSQQNLNIRTALALSQGTTSAATGGVVDMAPTASVGKRSCKVVVVASGVSGTSPVFPLTLSECATTNGTFTAVDANNLITSVSTDGTSEYHCLITKRYIKCTVGTVTGTTPVANIVVLVQSQGRSA